MSHRLESTTHREVALKVYLYLYRAFMRMGIVRCISTTSSSVVVSSYDRFAFALEYYTKLFCDKTIIYTNRCLTQTTTVRRRTDSTQSESVFLHMCNNICDCVIVCCVFFFEKSWLSYLYTVMQVWMVTTIASTFGAFVPFSVSVALQADRSAGFSQSIPCRICVLRHLGYPNCMYFVCNSVYVLSVSVNKIIVVKLFVLQPVVIKNKNKIDTFSVRRNRVSKQRKGESMWTLVNECVVVWGQPNCPMYILNKTNQKTLQIIFG